MKMSQWRKILEFLEFIDCGKENINLTVPYCIYSTSQRRDREYRYLFSGTTDITEPIAELQKWGKLLDKYLISEKEFYQLDYLCNALFDLGKKWEKYLSLHEIVFVMCIVFRKR